MRLQLAESAVDHLASLARTKAATSRVDAVDDSLTSVPGHPEHADASPQSAFALSADDLCDNTALPPSPAMAPPPIPGRRSDATATTPSSAELVAYGIYAIIVHSGESANSGHYYAFCRRSDAEGSDLSLPDCPRAPWLKFNDTSVTPTLWTTLTQALESSTSDTAYVLFYKRLHGAAASGAVTRWRASGSVAVGAAASLQVLGISEAVAAATHNAEAQAVRSATPVSAAASALSGLLVSDDPMRDQTAVMDGSYSGASRTPHIAHPQLRSLPPPWATRVLDDNARLIAAELLERHSRWQADLARRAQATDLQMQVNEVAGPATGVSSRRVFNARHSAARGAVRTRLSDPDQGTENATADTTGAGSASDDDSDFE